jgi:hypothetical protein
MSRWCHTTVATQLSSLLITIGQKTLVFKRSDPLNFSCYEALPIKVSASIKLKCKSGQQVLFYYPPTLNNSQAIDAVRRTFRRCKLVAENAELENVITDEQIDEIVSKLRSGESMLEVSAILKDPPR